jgi:Spy/CpxP family protein refolding chaperone
MIDDKGEHIMNKRHMGKAAVVVLLAGVSFMAMAQQRQRHQRRGPGGEWWNNPQTIDALQLDEQTRGMIEEEVHSSKLEAIELKGDVERAQLELQRMLHTEPMPSNREIEAQVDDLVKAQGKVMKQEILLRARILAMLLPEQRAELESLHQQRREAVRRDFRDRQPREPRAPRPPEPPVEPNQ